MKEGVQALGGACGRCWTDVLVFGSDDGIRRWCRRKPREKRYGPCSSRPARAGFWVGGLYRP